MRERRSYGRWMMRMLTVLLVCQFQFLTAHAQKVNPVKTAERQHMVSDSLVAALDSMYNAMPSDSALLAADTLLQKVDTVKQKLDSVSLTTLPTLTKIKVPRDWSVWKPSPLRAVWLALVIPGGGQIYNRKYWKLPLIYGGFVGCIYAMSWNNMMYKDYSQAYLDIMDSDPGTASYNKFLHLGRQITPENEERYKTIFKKRKDRYRRYRDLSFFVMVGVYALSVIDAYVDAELSEFDISKDLSMSVRPTVFSNSQWGAAALKDTSVGLQCSLNF